MKILDRHQVEQKIRRLAIEILENNHDEPEVFLAGINRRGYRFAEMLVHQLRQISSIQFHLLHVQLDPASPLQRPIELDTAVEELQGKVVIIVDDVANTGRTIFFACKPLLQTLPKKVEVAVLVDRTHKSFPIKVDYVGLSLATTLREHIQVELLEDDKMEAYLS